MEAETLGDIFYMAFGSHLNLSQEQVLIMCMLERQIRARGACDFMMKRTIGTFVHLDYATWCKEMDVRILPALQQNPRCPWEICSWYRGKTCGQAWAKARSEPGCILCKEDLLKAADAFELTIGLIVPDEEHTRRAIRNFHRKVDCSLFQVCFVHGWEDMQVPCTHMKSGHVPFQLYKGAVAVVDCAPVFHNWWGYSELEEEKILADVLKTIFESMSYDYLGPNGSWSGRKRIFVVNRAQLLRVQSYENFPQGLGPSREW